VTMPRAPTLKAASDVTVNVAIPEMEKTAPVSHTS